VVANVPYIFAGIDLRMLNPSLRPLEYLSVIIKLRANSGFNEMDIKQNRDTDQDIISSTLRMYTRPTFL
jgi:hypothetical protein